MKSGRWVGKLWHKLVGKIVGVAICWKFEFSTFSFTNRSWIFQGFAALWLKNGKRRKRYLFRISRSFWKALNSTISKQMTVINNGVKLSGKLDIAMFSGFLPINFCIFCIFRATTSVKKSIWNVLSIHARVVVWLHCYSADV